MTRDTQRKTFEYAMMIAGAVATMFFSLGLARRELDGKEDASAHELDLERLRARIELQAVRDSAERADTRRIMTDISCQLNPTRDYCSNRRPR
jgi:hypothetical protein